MDDGRKIFLLPFPKFHGNDFSQERPDWQDYVAGAVLSALHSRNFPKLVRLSASGFAIVKTRHVLDLRCSDVKFVVRSPAYVSGHMRRLSVMTCSMLFVEGF